MERRKQGGFELIASMPWPVGVVLGIVVYVGVRYLPETVVRLPGQ